MIITETPMRISFLGGGTDFPTHFMQHGGAILGTAIDKFAYHSTTPFYSPLFDYSVRISYRQVECVQSVRDIKHEPFKACLQHFAIESNIEVNYTAELPTLTGLGTSSTFLVGLLNCLSAYKGRRIGAQELAELAIFIERDVLKESVGYQDQILAAYGGINYVEFRRQGDFVAHRLPICRQRLDELEQHLLLLYTGMRRRSSTITQRHIENIPDNSKTLIEMQKMADQGANILMNAMPISEFGHLLHKNWIAKSSLSAAISNPTIKHMYQTALDSGAIGGKLLGAGGGGFLLIFVPPDKRQAVKDSLPTMIEVPFHINAPGSRVIHVSNSSMAAAAS